MANAIEFESIWLSAGLAFALSVGFVRALRPLALRWGLVDQPDSRKAHGRAVPLTGGVAIFLGIVLAALSLPFGLANYWVYFAGAAILVSVGLVDDVYDLSSKVRFVAQIIVSLMMIYLGGTVLDDFGTISPTEKLVSLGVFSVGLTVFSVVGVINAINMVDGLDGLAGSLILIALGSLAWLSFDAGRLADFGIVAILAAALAGFLMFNFPLPGRSRASAFMGDAGSMFLGFSVAWLVVGFSQGEERIMAPVTALWLLAVPLLDTVWLIAKRACTLRWPTQSATDHLHHVLIRAGFKPTTAVGIMGSLGVAGAVFGLVGHHQGISEHHMFYTFLGVFALYCLLFASTWWQGSLFGRKLARRAVTGDTDAREN